MAISMNVHLVTQSVTTEGQLEYFSLWTIVQLPSNTMPEQFAHITVKLSYLYFMWFVNAVTYFKIKRGWSYIS